MKVHNLGGSTPQAQSGMQRAADKWIGVTHLVSNAKPGDRININGENEYAFGSQTINGLQLVGTGSPQKTILSGGQLEFAGNSVLANCTIKCTRIAKTALAFRTVQPGSVLAVHNVLVEAPTRMRPAHPDVYIGKNTSVWAFGSALGRVLVDGGQLHVSPSSSAVDVSTVNGGTVVQVPEYGQIAPEGGPPANQAARQEAGVIDQAARQAIASGLQGRHLREAVKQAARQAPRQNRQAAPPPAPTKAAQPPNTQPTPTAQSRGLLPEPASVSPWASLLDTTKQAASAFLSQREASAGAQRPAASRSGMPQPSTPIGPIGHPGPQVHAGRALTWRAVDGHDWKTAISSQLEVGDTVYLEEGEYWLPGTMLNNIKILGTGAPDRTVLNIIDGSLQPGTGQSLSLSNLTIRSKAGSPAIANTVGRSMTLFNVVIDHPLGSDDKQMASVGTASGTTTMRNCEVRYDKYDGSGFVSVVSGGKLHAMNSDLGLLACSRGVAELENCSVSHVDVDKEGHVTVAHTLWLTKRGSTDTPAIATETGGSIAVGQVVTQEKTTPIKADSGSTINIGTFIAPEDSEATIEELEDATIHVGGNPDQIRRTSGDQSLTRKPSNRTIAEVLAELDNMIGQDEVKQQVRSLIALTELNKTRRDRGLTTGDSPITQHFIFAGPPGTGKTTIARIIGDVFRALGALKSGHVVEVDRSNLVGENFGSPGVLTTERLDEAMDGVLLVDEAYSLQQEGYQGGDAPGNEVIATILKRMEDDRDRLVVIATGYSEDMERFLDANPGLRDRFRSHITFTHYSADELVQIVLSMANSSGSRISDDAIQVLHAAMQDIERQGLNQSRTFGNGRFARNLVARAEQEQAVRLSQLPNPSNDDLTTLNDHDMKAALANEMRKLRP